MSSAGLSKDDQTELQSFLEGEQAKARVQSSIQNFTELCFDKCITGGISSSFSRKEEQCLSNCVERFLDTRWVESGNGAELVTT